MLASARSHGRNAPRPDLEDYADVSSRPRGMTVLANTTLVRRPLIPSTERPRCTVMRSHIYFFLFHLVVVAVTIGSVSWSDLVLAAKSCECTESREQGARSCVSKARSS